MAVPSWVSKELFEDALREYFSDKSIKILGFSSSTVVPAGDNYTSDLFRTRVTYQIGQKGNPEAISLVVKCTVENKEQIKQLVKEIRLFEKEIEMYRKTLPAIDDLLGCRGTLSASLIYFLDKSDTVIMFEDLKILGFKMHDRQQGLDLEHCLLLVEKLANLHAASVVLQEKNTSAMDNYGKSIFSDNPMIVEWAKGGFQSIINACKNCPGLEKYSNRLNAIKSKVITKAQASAERKLGGFSVLNHGDAWVNNFMFSYHENGKLKDCRLVDFQLVVFTSPAIDLHYFWATSPRLDVRKEHLDTVLDRYYSQLLLTLSKLKYCLDRVPTKEQFRKDWNSRAFYGLTASITVLPLVKASARNDASFDNIMGSEEKDSFRHHIYNNEGYLSHMAYLLPFYEGLGALDCY